MKGNFTKLTLHLYFILFHLLSVIVTFYSEFQTVITP